MRNLAMVGLVLGATVTACGSSNSPSFTKGGTGAVSALGGSGGELAGSGGIATETGGAGGGNGGVVGTGGTPSSCTVDTDCPGGDICTASVCVSARGTGGTSGATSSGGAGGTGGQALTDAGNGTGGEKGTGGAAGDGGAKGTGGEKGGPDSGAPTGVACGTKSCNSGEDCCFTPANPRAQGSVATYTCVTPDGGRGAACALGSTPFTCRSNDDCTGKQKCCAAAGFGGPGAMAGYTCQDDCTMGSSEVGCSSTSCDAGEVCCWTLATAGMMGMGAGTPASFACAKTCAMGDYELCTSNADCPKAAMGARQTTCQDALASPPYPVSQVCR